MQQGFQGDAGELVGPAFSRMVTERERNGSLGDRAVRSSIAQRLALLTPRDAGRWGRMSAHQMVCHLSDSFRFALRRKPASDAGGIMQRTLIQPEFRS